MSAQHTPGPWSFWESDEKAKEPPAEGGLIEAPFDICAADSGISIAGLWFGTDCGQHISRREALANADLIASAPELLDLLKQALAFIEADSPPCGPGKCVGEVSAIDLKTGQRCEVDLFAVRAAIAKAEGR